MNGTVLFQSTVASPMAASFNRTLEQTEYGHQLSFGFTVFVVIYFIFLTVTGVGCNSLLIYTIVSRSKLRSVTNTFIVNLAICDFITAAVNVPQDAAFLVRGHYGGNVITCGFKEIAFFFSLPSSVANLLLLTIDRCIKIVAPFRYRELLTRRRVILLISIVWVYTLLVALFPILYDKNAISVENGACWMSFPWPYIYYTVSANFLLPLLLIIGLNVLLFMVARKHAAIIQSQVGRTRGSKRGQRLSMFSMLANMKAAKTILLLVGVFLVCWLTFISLATDNLLCNLCHPRELTWIGNCINYSSITLNPILYGLLNRQIRKEIRKLICIGDSGQNIYSVESRIQNDGIELR